MSLANRVSNWTYQWIKWSTCTKRAASTGKLDGPLAGIRVLDLTRILAGPYCTMILGDLGAEVIKIEKPFVGDETRNWGPPFIADQSCYFLSVNRNKKGRHSKALQRISAVVHTFTLPSFAEILIREEMDLSIAIDLKKPEGASLVRKIATSCDVFMENYLPGKLDTLGLGYKDIEAVAPQIVYCSVTGYSPRGPYRDRAGYDVIAASMGGLLHITGPADGEPCKVGVAITDICTGLYAHGAVMAALLQRQTTGKGQWINCNLLSTQIACLANIASNYLNAGKEATRQGTGHESIVPYAAFETLDGHLTVGVASEKQFQAMCKVMSLPQVAVDTRFKDNASRVKHREALTDILSREFKSKPTQEWLTLFEGSEIPYGPIQNMQQVFQDPQGREMVVKLPHKTAGEVSVVGPAVEFGAAINAVRSPPPLLGEHTDEVLSDFLSAREIARLRANKVVF